MAFKSYARNISTGGLATTSPITPVFLGSFLGAVDVASLSNSTVSLPQWDSTNRLSFIEIEGSASSSTAKICFSWIVPSNFINLSSTCFKIGIKFSDTSGNNGATLTVKDTAGSTVLSASALTESTSFAWLDITSGALSAGTYTLDGIVSFEITATTDAADTINIYGIKIYYA